MMQKIRRGDLVLFAVGWLCCTVPLFGQEPSSRFADLLAADAVRASAGVDREERSLAFANWMVGEDWKSLSLEDQVQLLRGVAADKLASVFSVRWTGYLTAQSDGRYTVRQMQQIVPTSTMRVWIADELVLDSSGNAETRFKSDTFDLSSNKPVEIRIEYIQEESATLGVVGAPMAVLAWQRGSSPLELVPNEALSVSSDRKEGLGLRGEYFAGNSFSAGDLRESRVDTTIAFGWHDTPVVPLHGDAYESVRGEVWKSVRSGQAFAGSEVQRERAMETVVPELANRLPLPERLSLVTQLTDDAQLRRGWSAAAVGRLMEGVHMLPGGEHIDLLVAWTQVNPHPTTNVGQYPREGDGFFETRNTAPYRRIGTLLRGSNKERLNQLWQSQLLLPDGQCNVRLIMSTAMAAHREGIARELLDAIRLGRADEKLSADQLATWLLAEARAQTLMVDGVPRPMRGIELLEEAMLVANSNELRFLILHDMIAIYASLDNADQAKQLIEQYGNEFDSADQRSALDLVARTAEELAQVYVDIRKRPVREAKRAAHLAELTRRLEEAKTNSKSEEIERYEQLIQSAQAVSPQE